MPGIGIGRTEHVSWGLTAAMVDNSDLWQEELNEAGTHYLVDGEWRELEILEEVIRIKDQPDQPLKIKLSHRGPLVGAAELRFNAKIVSGGSIPEFHDDNVEFSFGWGGAAPGETTFTFLQTITDGKSVPEILSTLDEQNKEKGYRGLAINLMMADI